ncbi:MAG: hypothetical protein M1812_005569 [Candelaria pacifica]|nr:MAG: hypothetical protein M1812_005569 [Candelaria pacifica]
MSLLDSSIQILDSGVNDFPRLAKVLQTTRHFELTSEPTLQAAQCSLLDEIAPEVDHLLRRVSTHLDKLERRQQSLIAKSELQEGRLGQSGSSKQQHSKGGKSMSGSIGASGVGMGAMSGEEAKLKQLRQKRERLSYAVERLTLQAQQKERQLRMSMAAQ